MLVFPMISSLVYSIERFSGERANKNSNKAEGAYKLMNIFRLPHTNNKRIDNGTIRLWIPGGETY